MLITGLQLDAQWPQYELNTTSEISGVHIHEDGTILLSGDLGLMKRSNDCGITWTDVSISYFDDLGKFYFIDNQIGFVLGDDAWIGKTIDGGESWIFGATPAIDDLEGIFFLDSEIGFLVGKEGSIVKTSDGGQSWEAQNSGVTSRLHGVYFFDPMNGIVCGRNNTLLSTTDGGFTWSTLNLGTTGDLRDFEFTNDQGFVAAEGGLYRFDDSLTFMEYISLDPPIDFEDIHFADSQMGWICGEQGTVMTTSNGGDAWTSITTEGLPFDLSSIYALSNELAFTAGEFGKVNGVCSAVGITEETGISQEWLLSMDPDGHIVLDIELDINSRIQVSIVDITGAIIYTELHSMDQGRNSLQIEAPVSTGLYLVSLENTASTSTKKIVIG